MADKPLEERTESLLGSMNFIVDVHSKPGCSGLLKRLTIPGHALYSWYNNRNKNSLREFGYSDSECKLRTFGDAFFLEIIKASTYFVGLQAAYQTITGNPLIQ